MNGLARFFFVTANVVRINGYLTMAERRLELDFRIYFNSIEAT